MKVAPHRLTTDADLSHEDAPGWYSAYGWHITTEHEGDVTLDAVDYDWLDGDDADVVAKLRERYEALTDDEAESLVERARSVREAAEQVESLLAEAVEQYQAGNVAGVVDALERADRIESEHGDSPATNSLRSELLEENEPLWDVPDDVQFLMMPQDGGQIVEVTYGVDGDWCYLYRHTFDRSDRTESYHRAEIDTNASDDEMRFEPQNGRLPACGDWEDQYA